MEILTVNQKKVPTTSGWQVDLKKAIRDVETLLEFVGLSDHDPGAFPTPTHRFPILVPRPFAERIRVGDPNDPLLRQVLNFPGIASRLPDESKQEDPGNSTGPWTKEPLEDKLSLIHI